MARVSVRGLFADYIVDLAMDAYPSDEEAIQQAFDSMFSMCGNAGQESLIGEHAEWFFEWGIEALEHAEARGTDFKSFAQIVIEECYGGRQDMWSATDLIWAEGWSMIAKQSGYHDSEDEYGEGAGQEFG